MTGTKIKCKEIQIKKGKNLINDTKFDILYQYYGFIILGFAWVLWKGAA